MIIDAITAKNKARAGTTTPPPGPAPPSRPTDAEARDGATQARYGKKYSSDPVRQRNRAESTRKREVHRALIEPSARSSQHARSTGRDGLNVGLNEGLPGRGRAQHFGI